MSIRASRSGIPADILALSHERDILRRKGQYARADELKREIESAGYAIKDNPHGAHLVILPSIEVDGEVYRTVRQLPSLINDADSCQFSVNILARNNFEQTRRCVESVLRFAGNVDLEIVLVNNASQDELSSWAEARAHEDARIRVLQVSRPMGEAEARNIGLKQSKGRYILLLDSSAEVVGDVFTPLTKTLEDKSIGITGLRGLHTDDLLHFEESTALQVEAVDGVCMAFRRSILKQVGLLDERYRFPYYMDIDFNFAVRNSGVRAEVTPDLPVVYHPALQSESLSDAELTRLKKRNFYRFLEKWGDREDLLIEEQSYIEENEIDADVDKAK